MPTPATISAADIVYAAYRKIGVLGQAGRGYSNSQGVDGMNALNRMLDAWNTEHLALWTELRTTYALTGAKQDYTIGPGASDFNTTRPMTINRASILLNYASSLPAELPMSILTYQEWQQITVKAINTPIPQCLYYETSAPVGTIHLWPAPSNSASQLILYTEQQFSQVETLTDTYTFAPGYVRAIIFNLAVEMADDYPRAVLKPATVQIAVDSKAWIKRRNVRPMDAFCDPGVLRQDNTYGYNIFTDSWQQR